jgi:hypothetical protein
MGNSNRLKSLCVSILGVEKGIGMRMFATGLSENASLSFDSLSEFPNGFRRGTRIDRNDLLPITADSNSCNTDCCSPFLCGG